MKNNVQVENNCIRKTLHNHEWSFSDFNMYRELSNGRDYFMKVISWISPTEYTAEKLDIVCDIQNALTQQDKYKFPREVYLDIYATYTKIYTDSLELSKNKWNDKFFMHRDLSLNNLVITKQNEIKVIDADSFHTTPYFIPWRYWNNLSTVGWLVNERLGDIHV